LALDCTWTTESFKNCFVTPPPAGQRIRIVMTYLYVCLVASISPELRVRSSPVLRTLHMSVARSSSGGVAIRYVLPVTSCLYIMARTRRRSSDSVGSSTDLPPQRIVKLTHQGAAPDRGRSLISTIALLQSVSFRLRSVKRVHVFSAQTTDIDHTLLVINFHQIAEQWLNQQHVVVGN